MPLSDSFYPEGSDGGPCLRGSRCSECGTVVFPKMPVCPSCLCNGVMAEAGIGRTARLFSHTIARVAPKGFQAPYYQAFADLPEGPRIFTLIGSECPIKEGVLRDGMELRLIIEPLAETPENRDVLAYKYVPAEKDRADA